MMLVTISIILADIHSLIVCQSPDDLKAQAHWDGAHGQSRRVLLQELSSMYSFLAFDVS